MSGRRKTSTYAVQYFEFIQGDSEPMCTIEQGT